MHSRKDYMNGDVTFREFYAQFVDEGIRRRVLQTIGRDRLLASDTVAFNDIKLSVWDRVMNPYPSSVRHKMELAGTFVTQACLVCIAKEAAMQIVEESR